MKGYWGKRMIEIYDVLICRNDEVPVWDRQSVIMFQRDMFGRTRTVHTMK